MSEIRPYSDRKLELDINAPLNIETIVRIQQMDCEGKRRDEIYRMLGNVSLEQINRVLDQDSQTGQRQERANVGYARVKGR